MAPPGMWVQRPADTVHHLAGLMLGRINGPQFLQADSVVLGAAICVEVEFADQLLAQMTSAAFGENGVLAEQFVAGSEAALLFALLADAHVTGCDAAHGTVFIVQNF